MTLPMARHVAGVNPKTLFMASSSLFLCSRAGAGGRRFTELGHQGTIGRKLESVVALGDNDVPRQDAVANLDVARISPTELDAFATKEVATSHEDEWFAAVWGQNRRAWYGDQFIVALADDNVDFRAHVWPEFSLRRIDTDVSRKCARVLFYFTRKICETSREGLVRIGRRIDMGRLPGSKCWNLGLGNVALDQESVQPRDRKKRLV